MRLSTLPFIPLLAAGLLVVAPPAARAQQVGSEYEGKLMRWALEREGLEPEPSPAGKTIERVVIVREEIIAESDPWPNFLNALHATTRQSVVQQELLIGRGDAWDEDLVRESERNLRKLPILGVALARACKGSAPGRVVLLVVTKDLWSIRFNTRYSMVGSTVQLYDFFPTEQNFLGHNKRVSLHVQLNQLELSDFSLHDSFALGEMFEDPRVLGSRLRLTQRFDAVIAGDVPCGGGGKGAGGVWCPDKSFGELEGIYGYLWLERPLYALSTRWGFSMYGLVDRKQVRAYIQSPAPVLRTVSLRGVAPGLSELDRAPRVYDRSIYEVSARVTRSLGRQIKHDISGGLSAYRQRYTVPDGFAFGEQAARWMAKNYMPRSEAAAYLSALYHTHEPRYVRMKNIKTLGLTEDVRLGHDVKVELRGAAGLADFEPLFLALLVEASYRWEAAQNLFEVWVAGRGRWQPSLEEEGFDDPWANAILQAELREITPPVPGGRFHLRAGLTLRHNDLSRERSYLGGDMALRGFPSKHFEGDNRFQVNMEFRSLAVSILTLHLGLVVFYDGGAVWGGPDPEDPGQALKLRYHQSIGLGLRALFPQFDTEPMRIDFGIPLRGEGEEIGTWFSVSFKHAF